MARPLLISPFHNLLFSSMPITIFFVVLAIFSMFSVITFLCGNRRMNKFQIEAEEATRSKEDKLISKLNRNISNRALSMVNMLSWRKLRTEEEEEEEGEGDEADCGDQDEEALWRKNILMGERCRPLDFSGKIEYDSEGKTLPDLSPHDEHH
ncbi:uncharacterized protein LOC133310924 [Gastrolobium bilobum]|uniref:uncharacterized protein LOC133310924 n=1 Tax=Gastrolobium bilobum TaxID=150636 RepID=UPI002AB27129|nr:uncharacterized protein LOC133310924 [Gastrolobium bilobum]